jgi:hypothetical protein
MSVYATSLLSFHLWNLVSTIASEMRIRSRCHTLATSHQDKTFPRAQHLQILESARLQASYTLRAYKQSSRRRHHLRMSLIQPIDMAESCIQLLPVQVDCFILARKPPRKD